MEGKNINEIKCFYKHFFTGPQKGEEENMFFDKYQLDFQKQFYIWRKILYRFFMMQITVNTDGSTCGSVQFKGVYCLNMLN